MSVRLDELPDRLREFGVEPREVAGWQDRGASFPAKPVVAVRHWTAGGSGHAPSLSICTYGRSDLPGPLCQVLQARGGAAGGRDLAYVVAAGIANHAGEGSWRGVSGNSRSLGNEIEWSGPTESFPAARIDVSERVAAAFQSLCGDPSGDNCCEHREWAPTRKIDTNLDGLVMRTIVDALLLTDGDDMTPDQEAKLHATHLLATAAADGVAELAKLLEPLSELLTPLLREKDKVPYARLKHIVQRPADTDLIAQKVLAGLKDGKATQSQIEAAFRNVLGSLDTD